MGHIKFCIVYFSVFERKDNRWFMTIFFKGLVTHNDILKIYKIMQYSKNIFKL